MSNPVNKAKRRRVRMWCRLKRRSRKQRRWWTLDPVMLKWLEGRLPHAVAKIYGNVLPPRAP